MKPNFENPKKIETIVSSLRVFLVPKIKEEREVLDAARAREIALQSRLVAFKGQLQTLETEIPGFQGKVSEILNNGGDPSEANKLLRAKIQEKEDLQGWIVGIEKEAMPAAAQSIAQAELSLARAASKAVGEFKSTYQAEMNEHLERASEIITSWESSLNLVLRELEIFRPLGNALKCLLVNPSQSLFSKINMGVF